jgi:hypothetical protein
MHENPYEPPNTLPEVDAPAKLYWTRARVCWLATFGAYFCPFMAVVLGLAGAALPVVDGPTTFTCVRLILVFGHVCAVVGLFSPKWRQVAVSLFSLIFGGLLSYVCYVVTMF